MKNKPIKALLIDAENKTIKEVELPAKSSMRLDAMYKLIKCDLVAIACEFDNKDAIFVDDEGLCKWVEFGFSIKGHPQDFFAGNGLLVGCNRADESVDYKSGMVEIASKIKFLGITKEEA